MKAVFAVLFLATLPLATQADTLDIKTGAWELTKTTVITGTPVPKETLDKLAPAQRDEMEVKMRAVANGGDPVKSRSCLTRQELDSSDLLDDDETDCTRKVKALTKRYLELEETCKAPDASKTLVRVEAASQEEYSGSVDRTAGDGKVHVEIVGHWIGPTCEKGMDD
jgi:hypothetical protein